MVSCVIIEPTYNHEREGRGNFVQEGKSGELASPPRLSHWADWCGWPPVTSAAAVAQSRPAPTFIGQSMAAAAERSLAFSRFVRERAALWPPFKSCRRASVLWRKPLHLQFSAHADHNRMTSFFTPPPPSTPTLSLSLSLSLRTFQIGKWSHFVRSCFSWNHRFLRAQKCSFESQSRHEKWHFL